MDLATWINLKKSTRRDSVMTTTTAKSVELDIIEPGDVVTIYQPGGNIATGIVQAISPTAQLGIQAFGMVIPFARKTRSRTGGDRWGAVGNIQVTEHQQPLIRA